jgi:hypothetical protein
MSYFTAGRLQIPGKIGYVLKPNYLLGNQNYVKNKIQKMIQIKILSNH